MSATLVLASCGSREPLVVKQFTVRDTDSSWSEDLLIRGESQKRLFGAVELADREKRKGQYYSVRWRANPAGGPVKVRFQYRQTSTGSRLHELEANGVGDQGDGSGRICNRRRHLPEGRAGAGLANGAFAKRAEFG